MGYAHYLRKYRALARLYYSLSNPRGVAHSLSTRSALLISLRSIRSSFARKYSTLESHSLSDYSLLVTRELRSQLNSAGHLWGESVTPKIEDAGHASPWKLEEGLAGKKIFAQEFHTLSFLGYYLSQPT